MINDEHITLEYLQRFVKDKSVFIETGTHLGNAVETARQFGFETIHSIEIDPEYHAKAVERFKDYPHIHIHLGDSATILGQLIDNSPAGMPITFWLDAHASGPLLGNPNHPCPLLLELDAMREKRFVFDGEKATSKIVPQKHTIFIDDRRLLGSAEWGFVRWPQIVDALKLINPEYSVTFLDGHVENDVVCCFLGEHDE